MQGPSARDIFFCTRADLIVLLWDGESAGTRDLIQFYQQQGVSNLLTFI